MAAGLATLCEMEHQNAFQILEELGQMLDNLVEEELSPFAETQKFCYVRLGSFFCFFFGTSTAPQNFIDVTRTKTSFFNKVYHEWLKAGVYLGPSSYEVGFLSTCIELSDLEKLVGTIKKVFSEQK
jgi:glutamate-1-semialdehyde 2,1-aminomutase